MNCLSSRAEFDVPVIPALPSPAKLPIPPLAPGVAHAGLLDAVVGDVTGETVGIAGANGLGIAAAEKGDMFVVGIAGAELTPRLLISMAPNGIPVRGKPPGTVGDVDVAEVDVGVDDAAMLLEPEPHAPDIPDVSIPEDVDIPSDADIPGIAIVSDAAVFVVTGLPVVAAVAGAAVPAAVPPPS
jgi:hypothetical protein